MDKKTILTLIICAVLLFSSCSSVSEHGGSDDSGITGPANENTVEKLGDNTEKLSHYDGKGRLVFWHIITYDDSGRIIHKTSYDAAGVEQGSYDFTYNENGDPLDSAWFFWDKGYLMKTEREYDEEGRLVMIHNYGDESRSVVGNMTYNHYDENGRKDSDVYYSVWNNNGSHGEPEYNYYTFNEIGKVSRMDIKNETGDLLGYRIFEYNEQGLRISDTSYKSNGDIEFRYVYKYDENGNKTEEERYDGSGNLVSVDKY